MMTTYTLFCEGRCSVATQPALSTQRRPNKTMSEKR